MAGGQEVESAFGVRAISAGILVDVSVRREKQV